MLDRSSIVDRSVQLPRTLGGASVGLLMGITSTKTDPVLVYTLPNGLGIYRSPFKDRDGCSLAYGGPHQIFSRRHSNAPGDDGYSRWESYTGYRENFGRKLQDWILVILHRTAGMPCRSL